VRPRGGAQTLLMATAKAKREESAELWPREVAKKFGDILRRL
jgi:hypothetical protein